MIKRGFERLKLDAASGDQMAVDRLIRDVDHRGGQLDGLGLAREIMTVAGLFRRRALSLVATSLDELVRSHDFDCESIPEFLWRLFNKEYGDDAAKLIRKFVEEYNGNPGNAYEILGLLRLRGIRVGKNLIWEVNAAYLYENPAQRRRAWGENDELGYRQYLYNNDCKTILDPFLRNKLNFLRRGYVTEEDLQKIEQLINVIDSIGEVKPAISRMLGVICAYLKILEVKIRCEMRARINIELMEIVRFCFTDPLNMPNSISDDDFLPEIAAFHPYNDRFLEEENAKIADNISSEVCDDEGNVDMLFYKRNWREINRFLNLLHYVLNFRCHVVATRDRDICVEFFDYLSEMLAQREGLKRHGKKLDQWFEKLWPYLSLDNVLDEVTFERIRGILG